MALFDIHHSCGHTTEQQIYGTDVNNERQRQAEKLGRGPCPDCRRRQYDEGNRAAAEAAEAAGWPALTGTPKQIAWAQSLRAQAVDHLSSQVRMAYAWTEDMMALAATLLVHGHTAASWWIDHRAHKRWLDLVKDDPAWIEAVAQLPPGATFEQIQLDLDNCETLDDFAHVLRCVDLGRRAGQLTDAQLDELAPTAHRVKMRLYAEWGS